ncbi:Ribosomal protein S14, mitochondrial [Clarias magur]|uniref:Ribosomal protein S14, mitochondrial n=1 Tax=Clarias magur TaxID=1594786 RepID=A0A8J4U7J2_CLAMG|nr:Ribosomal protein S14, mitochondrial [Clarias magur]
MVELLFKNKSSVPKAGRKLSSDASRVSGECVGSGGPRSMTQDFQRIHGGMK